MLTAVWSLFMVGLAAGVIALTAWFVDGQSLAAQNIALAVVVILCTLGLIFGISAVSTPPGARLTTRLPPNVPTVTLHRARIRPWVRALATILGGSLPLMLVPGPVRYIAGACASIVAFAGVILWPVAYVMALRADRAVTALQLNPWLHWHYSAESWNAWSGQLAQLAEQPSGLRISPAARRWRIMFLAGGVALTTAVGLEGSLLVRLGSGAMAGLVLMCLLSLMTQPESPHAAQRRAGRLRAAQPDTFFGHDGVLCNGEFCAWQANDGCLLSASVAPGPPRHIELWFEKIRSSAYGIPQATKICKEVLIAADAAPTDLPALQAALIARCPDAKITLL
jgi:hypothetical protein